MVHLPAHGLPGSLCTSAVTPTAGLLPFPHPDSLPADAGDDLCPECRRVYVTCVNDWNRAARGVFERADRGLPVPPGHGDPARFA